MSCSTYSFKNIIVCVIILFTLSMMLSPVNASSDQKSSAVSTWIKTISIKLKLVSSTAGKDKKGVVTGVKVITPSETRESGEKPAVIGTKGAPEANADGLYYKDTKVGDEELRLMESALRLAEMGSNEEAIKKLEELLKKYPKSSLADDAKEGINALRGAKP